MSSRKRKKTAPAPAAASETAAPPPADTFPIVGVGASAGGLEALLQLLGGLPIDTGMAFVVVQHLAAKHESILGPLLARATSMPVIEAEEHLKVRPNHVYVIQPKQDLMLRDGHISVEPRPTRAGPHMPIDIFFRTLAAVHDDLVIGVILSGTGSDGTLGLRAIRQSGGIGIAQEPETAAYQGMPRSAIAHGGVDFVLPPAAIGAELARLATAPRPVAVAKPSPSDDDPFRKILTLVRRGTGSDFSSYKKTTLLRRIRRRMLVREVERLEEYEAQLANDPAEVAALHQDLLINVTSFFRDPEAFAYLTSKVLPQLFAERDADAPLRVWVPGCSTGEEAYSLAICLLESAAALDRRLSIQVFASDISEKAIERARAGMYLENIAADVSPERLARWFVKVDSQYHVSKSVRDMCIFARQDVTRDPPFSRLDLISCRNLLIYLESSLQQRVLGTFHYALRHGGYLMLGTSETVGPSAEYFHLADREHRVYVKAAVASPLPGYGRRDAALAGAGATAVGAKVFATPPAAHPLQREAQRLLMTRFGPASVLVGANLEALEMRGDTGPFLEHRPGDASLNLLRIVRQDLTAKLRQALQEARTNLRPSRKERVSIRRDDGVREIALEVLPVSAPGIDEPGYLVVFEDTGPKRPAPHSRPARATPDIDRAELERELETTRQHLQATIESQDAANEELQSANEEILSANEELQSINEELETAKEELQSSNEELTTLNDELQSRNVALGRLSDDLTNVLDSVGMPIAVVGGDLVLRRFTPGAARLLNLIPSDVGRPFDIIRPNLDGLQCASLVQRAMTGGLTVEQEVGGTDGRTYSVRAHPYRTRDNQIDGAVLTFVDVTEARKQVDDVRADADAARLARERSDELGRLKEEFVATVSHELRGPLNAMVGWLHLLRQDELGGAAAETAIAGLDRAIQMQLRLVNDLLDYARIEAGNVRLTLAPVGLVQVAEAALATVSTTAQERGVNLVIDPEAHDEVVLADGQRMQQVFGNLLANAVRATPRGGNVTVEIDRRGTHIEIGVRDTGHGIPPERLPQLFERKRLADPGQPRSASGLGLGLTVVRQLVEMHGGRVRAESDGKGKGALFTVSLPLPPVRLYPGVLPLPEAPRLEDNSPRLLDGLKVLVVEDDGHARELLRQLVELYGADVVAVASGAEVTASLEHSTPDVLVSDIGMPEENGYDLLRRIRARDSRRGGRVPALALTAYAARADRQRALDSGFNEHLTKPAAPESLIAAIAKLAGR